MKIVILDGYTENPGDLSWAGFEALGELSVYDRTRPEQTAERIGDAEIVITNKTVIDEKVLSACLSIRYIGVLATGYNVVDTAAAAKRSIPVCNIPTYGTDAVAQYVFALLLECCHHVGHHAGTVRQGRWCSSPDFCYWDYPLLELKGKTMGFIGFGRIGQRAAEIARAFGMRTVAYNRSQSERGAQLAEYLPLEELLAVSDVISLHCPLFPETKGMINRKCLALCRDGVILINTARGPLVQEEDLAEALESGKVGFYAADVASVEPIPADSPLLTAKNCLITPHIAWASRESRERLMKIAVENLRAFLNGKPQNLVN